MKKFMAFFLLSAIFFANVLAEDLRELTQRIASEVVMTPDKVLRVNNQYDEYVKFFENVTVYVAPKLFIAVKIVLKDEKGSRTYFAVDLGMDGSCDRIIRVPGSNIAWYEESDAFLCILGNIDEETMQTKIDLVGVKKEINFRPYLNRSLYWKVEKGWRIADFEEEIVSGVLQLTTPEKLWEQFITKEVSRYFY